MFLFIYCAGRPAGRWAGVHPLSSMVKSKLSRKRHRLQNLIQAKRANSKHQHVSSDSDSPEEPKQKKKRKAKVYPPRSRSQPVRKCRPSSLLRTVTKARGKRGGYKNSLRTVRALKTAKQKNRERNQKGLDVSKEKTKQRQKRRKEIAVQACQKLLEV